MSGIAELKGKIFSLFGTYAVPAVLVEGGFLSNPMEAQLLQNSDYRDRLVAAIAEGILSYERTRPRLPYAAPGLASRN